MRHAKSIDLRGGQQAPEVPQLELVTNPTLIWQLNNGWRPLPFQYMWQIVLMQKAAERIQMLHDDYTRNGPMTDEERLFS